MQLLALPELRLRDALVPRRRGRDRMGVNARLLDPEVLAAATLRTKDAAVTGRFR